MAVLGLVHMLLKKIIKLDIVNHAIIIDKFKELKINNKEKLLEYIIIGKGEKCRNN